MIKIYRKTMDEKTRIFEAYDTETRERIRVRHTWAFNAELGGAWYDESHKR